VAASTGSQTLAQFHEGRSQFLDGEPDPFVDRTIAGQVISQLIPAAYIHARQDIPETIFAEYTNQFGGAAELALLFIEHKKAFAGCGKKYSPTMGRGIC